MILIVISMHFIMVIYLIENVSEIHRIIEQILLPGFSFTYIHNLICLFYAQFIHGCSRLGFDLIVWKEAHYQISELCLTLQYICYLGIHVQDSKCNFLYTPIFEMNVQTTLAERFNAELGLPVSRHTYLFIIPLLPVVHCTRTTTIHLFLWV